MNPIPLPERIHQIISGHKGIKASRLCAHLATEYVGLSQKEIRTTLIVMVMTHELYEIEYTLPDNTNESIILPNGSRFRGDSKGELR